MTVEQFTKQNVRPTADEILKVLRDNFGYDFDAGRITFEDSEFQLKLTVRLAGSANQYERDFELVKSMSSDLEHLNLGDWIVMADRKFKITGYNRKAKKNRLIIVDEKGKEFACPTRATMRDGSSRLHTVAA